MGGVVGKGAEIATVANLAADAFAREGVLTNLGVLTFKNRFGALKLESMWGPAVMTGMEGEQTIGVTTVNGSLCLTHTSHTPLEGLLEAMRSVLVDACQCRIRLKDKPKRGTSVTILRPEGGILREKRGRRCRMGRL
jgi:hypothetical protein